MDDLSPAPFGVPGPPEWEIAWERIEAECAWVGALRDCAQDPVHHAEGDVWTHTRMVGEALAQLDTWRARGPEDRAVLFTAALLHDVAKPRCSRTDAAGHIHSPGHSVRGGTMSRRILWEAGVAPRFRERVAGLVRHHHVLHHLLEREDAIRAAIRTSMTAPWHDLDLLGHADILGREASDRDRLLENLDTTAEYLAELHLHDGPWPFPSDHSRVLYFRKADRDPAYHAYDDTRCCVTVMSGMPGAGKSTWVGKHAADLPVVSLDNLRDEMGVGPKDNQGRVVQESRERIRVHLRSAEDFVYDATNLSLTIRWPLVQLMLDYKARVHIVHVETDPSTLFERNRQRERGVPASALDRLLDRWEMPDLTEAHEVLSP